VTTVNKNPAYPTVVQQLKNKVIKPMLGFKSFKTAEKTIAGIEVLHMLRKGQVECNHSSALSTVKFINKLFGLIA
jgi:IS6 family transposase